MRACIIFNPNAKGGRARWFQQHANRLAGGIQLFPTSAPGGARPLAAEAVARGFDTLIAAGGDGTLNEVINGLAEVPEAFDRVRLGVLPLGTANVFARELALPFNLLDAWRIILQGNEIQVDIGQAEFFQDGSPARRLFLQLGGAGLDARAIELLNHRLKKLIGPLAYVWAGLRALRETQPRLEVRAGDKQSIGELALLGNGRRYGGPLKLFPFASLKDRRLDVTLFLRANWKTLCRVARDMWNDQWEGLGGALHWQGEVIELKPLDSARIPFELDGEWVGLLPLTARLQSKRLRVLC